MSVMVKIACGVAALYLTALVVLFFAQRTFIFPAPTDRSPPPLGFEEVLLRAQPGLALSAAYRPARQGMDTVVFFHGNADNWAGGEQATKVLADAGYGILLPEYRGYSGNSGKPDEEGLYDDGRAALTWLGRQGIAAKRTVLIGNSLGSGVAVQLASENPVAALVLISPYSSMVDVVGEKVPWVPATLLVRDRFTNLKKLPSVQSPVLIMHGEQDSLIPAAHSRRLAQSAPEAALMLFADAGHDLTYRAEAGVAVRDWLAHLPHE